MIACSLPVLTTFGPGARREPLIGLLGSNFRAVGQLPGNWILSAEYVLENRFLRVQIFAGSAIELPHDTGLASRHDCLLVAVIDKDALEDLIQIQALARRMVVE